MKCCKWKLRESLTKVTYLKVRENVAPKVKYKLRSSVCKSNLDKATRGRVFKAEGTARAKVLRQGGVWSFLLTLLEIVR